MQRRLAVRAVIIKDNKLLLVKLKPYDITKHTGPDFWCTIGGGLDENESLIPALKREVYEETGIHAEVGRLLFVQQFVFQEKENLEFFFHVTNTEDFENIDLASTSHGTIEIAELAFVDPNTEHVLPRLLSEVNIQEHISENRQTLFFDYLNER